MNLGKLNTKFTFINFFAYIYPLTIFSVLLVSFVIWLFSDFQDVKLYRNQSNINDLFKIAVFIFSLISSTLNSMRSIEILDNIIWIKRNKEEYINLVSDFSSNSSLSKIKSSQLHNFFIQTERRWSSNELRYTKIFFKIPASFVKKLFLGRLYRHTSLIIIQAISVFLLSLIYTSNNSSKLVFLINLIVILFSLFIYLFHIVYKVTYIGYFDEMFFAENRKSETYNSIAPEEFDLSIPKRKIYLQFLIQFSNLMISSVVGFSVIYFSISNLILKIDPRMYSFDSSTYYFPEIFLNNFLKALDFTYFSVVTIATVGFGDIYPSKLNNSLDAYWGWQTIFYAVIKIVLMIQIVYGFLTVTLLFNLFGNFSDTEDLLKK
jgi:Ion channel